MFELFDAHCHATPGSAPAHPGGIPSPSRGRLLCGASPDDWRDVGLLADAWENTTPAFGLHPWHAARGRPAWEESLKETLARFPRAWVGEIGLDFLKTASTPRDVQLDAFVPQLRLAKALGRRINLHCVKAYDELAGLLDTHYLTGRGDLFIIHSFSGPHQWVGRLAERGGYFSVGPLAARRGGAKARARVALIPPERLLLESDAHLPPGRDAEAELEETLAWLAGVTGVGAAALAGRIMENARRVYDA